MLAKKENGNVGHVFCERVSVRFHRHTFSNEGPYSKDCLIRCALMKCVM